MESLQSEQPAADGQTWQEMEPPWSEEPAAEGGPLSETHFAEGKVDQTFSLSVWTVGGEPVLGPCVQRAALTGRELSEMLSSAVAVAKPFKMLLGERVLGRDDSVFGGAARSEPVIVTLVAYEPSWLDYTFKENLEGVIVNVKAEKSTLEEVCRKTLGSKVDSGLKFLTKELGSGCAKDALDTAPELAEGLLSHVHAAEACECFLRTEYEFQYGIHIDNKYIDAFCDGVYISIEKRDEEFRS
eukprot:TRINITY_DN47970_c0_g1_i1.p1 TRINITY_DN47970_c0_g1~~TRINITY_DN47970_c0_g1_i1.p1  ORF type:complete len:242 (-),score=42.33 TRINITY_DN47970_c0_g1_i1:119-844(-)